MKLITEQIDSVEVLTEEKNGKKNLYIHGPFMVAEQEKKHQAMAYLPKSDSKTFVEQSNNHYVKECGI